MEVFSLSIVFISIITGFIFTLIFALITKWQYLKTNSKLVGLIIYYLITAGISFFLTLIFSYLKYNQIEIQYIIIAFVSSLFWPLSILFVIIALISEIGNPFKLFM